MKRWPTPTTSVEADALVQSIREALPTLDKDSEEFSEAVMEVSAFAGCFNHHLSRAHRKDLVQILGSLGESAISPALSDLVDCPRAEQLDTAIAIMHAICRHAIHREVKHHVAPDYGQAFGAESDEDELRVHQDRVCAASSIEAIAFKGEGEPPYVAHIYLLDGDHKVWAGTMWRNDRWQTETEIAEALNRWRHKMFHVKWWEGDE